MTPKLFHQTPTVQEYNELRRLAEWPTYEQEVVERAFSNTIFSVVARDESRLLIGMGRILGDNAIYLHVQDVIVHPAFQGQGIGKLIMDELLTHIEKVGIRNTNVGLMCSKGREKFYETFGFIERPNEKFGAGMIKILQ